MVIYAIFVANLRCFVARQFLSRIYALLSVKFSGLKMCECKKMTNIRYGPLIHCHSDYSHNSTQFKQLGHFAFSLGQLMQLNLIYATQTPHILHFHSDLSYIVIAVTRATQPKSSNSVRHFAFSLGQLTQLNLIYGGVKNENCK